MLHILEGAALEHKNTQPKTGLAELGKMAFLPHIQKYDIPWPDRISTVFDLPYCVALQGQTYLKIRIKCILWCGGGVVPLCHCLDEKVVFIHKDHSRHLWVIIANNFGDCKKSKF